MSPRRSLLMILVLLCIFLSGLAVFNLLNTDFGRINVSEVSMPDGDKQLSGLLYRPIAEPKLPGVVLAHGISSSKQSLSGVALELSKRGIVTLSVDLVGHGGSGGSLGEGSDPSFGVLAAIRYLEAKPFVDASRLGLVGHSLGAGAIRAAAAAHGGIAVSVFIGGGLGAMTLGPLYGSLNASFPRNLLVVVGREDVLFDIAQLSSELSPVFNASQVVPGHLFGSFSDQTARKLVTPTTTHLFEPLAPETVMETVYWMERGLEDGTPLNDPIVVKTTYLYREVALAIAAIALLGISSLLGSLILGMGPAQVRRIGGGSWSLGDLKVFFILGVLGVGLFFPMFLVGLAIPFPPLIFGASFAWWLFTVGAAELTVARFLLPKVSSVRLRLSSVIAGSFSLREAAAASVVFLILYAAARLVEVVLATDLRVVTPLLSSPWVVNRVLLVPVFLPFFLFYFLADGLYLYEFRGRLNEELGMTSKLVGAARAVLLNIGPYLVVLGVQYAPMFALGVRPLAGMAGFLLEFLWGIVPLFIVSSVFSWWFHRRTSMIGVGAVLNALVFAWSAASVFPFRG